MKSGKNEGVGYTRGTGAFPGGLRSPAWSPDGTQVIYEKVDYSPRLQNQLLYSWDPGFQYRYTDVFPSFSKDGTLLVGRSSAGACGQHLPALSVHDGGGAFRLLATRAALSDRINCFRRARRRSFPTPPGTPPGSVAFRLRSDESKTFAS